MELEEKITAIERMLDQLSKPPEDIPNCEVVIERVCCEKHGEYEQRSTEGSDKGLWSQAYRLPDGQRVAGDL